MRKTVILIGLFVFCFLQSSLPVAAQRVANPNPDRPVPIIDPNFMPPEPPPPNSFDIKFQGQDHYYSVLLRGNGEAVVNGRFDFANLGEQPVTDYTFLTSSAQPIDNLIVYQQIRKGKCLQYDSIPKYSNDSVCSQYDTNDKCTLAEVNKGMECRWFSCADKCLPYSLSVGDALNTPCPQKKCLENAEPDSYSTNWSGVSEYHKLAVTSHGSKVGMKLFKPVSPGKTGSIFFYYIQSNVAKSNLIGVWNYNFETVKISDRIRNLQIGISAENDFILNDAKGTTSYRPKELSFSAPIGKSAIASTEMDSYYGQIGQGTITKTNSNLQPGESFKIKGVYADASWKFYIKEILLSIVFALIAVVLVIVGLKKLIKHIHLPSFSVKKEILVKPQTSGVDINLILKTVGISFVSSFIIILILLLSYATNRFLSTIYFPYDVQTLKAFFYFLLGLILLFINLVIFFCPIYYFGRKHGIAWGLFVLFMNLFWLFIYTGVIILVVVLFSPLSTPPIYLMMQGIKEFTK